MPGGPAAATFAVNLSMMRIGRLTARRMRSDVFHKLLELPVSFFEEGAARELMERRGLYCRLYAAQFE